MLSALSSLAPLLCCVEEKFACVRAVYACVAYGARLVLGGLVMRRPNRISRRKVRRRRVTLQADRVYRGTIEQARVRSAVREMTCDAAFGFNYGVLKSKGSSFFRVALGADQVHL